MGCFLTPRLYQIYTIELQESFMLSHTSIEIVALFKASKSSGSLMCSYITNRLYKIYKFEL